MRGKKTIVREFTRQDVDAWVAWPHHADPLFAGYNPPFLTPRQRDLYYQGCRDAALTRQYAVDDLDGELVGRISIRDIDWRQGWAVLGISFHPGRLNRGLGSDALGAFLGYYFGPLDMHTLFLDVAAFNTRAARVYGRLGFRRCGQRWGEPQLDSAGIFRRPEYAQIRHLFLWDHGLIRPLLVDMILRRGDWLRGSEGAAPA